MQYFVNIKDSEVTEFETPKWEITILRRNLGKYVVNDHKGTLKYQVSHLGCSPQLPGYLFLAGCCDLTRHGHSCGSPSGSPCFILFFFPFLLCLF